MSVNPTIEVSDKTGTVKRIAASNITGDMNSDAMWYSSNASTIGSVPYTLSNANKEWILWERGNTVSVKFTADGSSPDGQGFNAQQAPGVDWTVNSVSGTVYVIRRKYINMADTHATMFANANRVAASAGMSLYQGDAIVCAKTSSFEVKLSASNELSSQYIAFGAVQIGIAD